MLNSQVQWNTPIASNSQRPNLLHPHTFTPSRRKRCWPQKETGLSNLYFLGGKLPFCVKKNWKLVLHGAPEATQNLPTDGRPQAARVSTQPSNKGSLALSQICCMPSLRKTYVSLQRSSCNISVIKINQKELIEQVKHRHVHMYLRTRTLWQYVEAPLEISRYIRSFNNLLQVAVAKHLASLRVYLTIPRFWFYKKMHRSAFSQLFSIHNISQFHS